MSNYQINQIRIFFLHFYRLKYDDKNMDLIFFSLNRFYQRYDRISFLRDLQLVLLYRKKFRLFKQIIKFSSLNLQSLANLENNNHFLETLCQDRTRYEIKNIWWIFLWVNIQNNEKIFVMKYSNAFYCFCLDICFKSVRHTKEDRKST